MQYPPVGASSPDRESSFCFGKPSSSQRAAVYGTQEDAIVHVYQHINALSLNVYIYIHEKVAFYLFFFLFQKPIWSYMCIYT